MTYSVELTTSEIAKLIYLELNKLNIEYTGNDDLLDDILMDSAFYIAYNNTCTDPREVLDRIDEYILSTSNKYPRYFSHGES